MLNPENDRSVVTESQWCVGEPPLRWDISFGPRLAEKVRQLFWRDHGDRQLPVKKETPPGKAELRKAA